MVYTELSGVSALHSVTESDEVARLLQMDSQDTASRGMSTLPAIMEDTLATPRFARYHQAMESADRLITEAMSADKNFELQLLQAAARRRIDKLTKNPRRKPAFVQTAA